ncbi:ribonuclease III domain-containing protein [Vararia minispora EC-137]|uniref:Ribonuclease III domain-containing protein n=1 Tax=Vararia minispora EC-137 TaxID=1314806 RepID=A0ACB8QMR4_9AGAM|nr:ribonuclease III domain-containing protein [Vararia minispora EC-137]
MSIVLPPTAELPELPPILNPEIHNRVFTHRSLFARPTHVFEDLPNDPAPDNEMLEHLGDQVLGLVVTDLIQEMHPNLRVGPSTKMRAMIVGNQTIAAVALRYKLPERLRLHQSQSITLKASMNVRVREQTPIQSYVGGLYKDQGLDAVSRWLSALFRPYVTEAYRVVRGQHGLPELAPHLPPQQPSPPPSPPFPPQAMIGHLGLFNQRLQQSNRAVEWVFADSVGEGTKATPVWVARAMVEGQEWGAGRGNTKKAAKNEAAKTGLKRLGVDVVRIRLSASQWEAD